MKAIVTGGAGFIGSHLVDALITRGDDVTVIDNLSTGRTENIHPQARFIEADVRHAAILAGTDIVFHLAAQADVQTSVERPELDASTNIIGTIRVLEGARRVGAGVVFSSTGGAIYGECEQPATETQPPQPMSPYGVSKLCAEEYIHAWNRIHGTDHTILRFANVYGPRQYATLEGGVVAIFLQQMRNGESCTIYGDGSAERDFIYVADVVRALLIAGERGWGSTFNIGTGVATSISTLHAACLSVIGSTAGLEFKPERPGDIRRSVLNLLHTALGLSWGATTKLADGLALTADA